MSEPAIPAAASSSPVPPRRRILFALGFFGVLAALFALRMYVHGLSHESTDDAFIEGRVIAISPEVAARVVSVHMDDNELVAKDAVLVELDRRDFEVRLEDARAALAAAIGRERSAREGARFTRVTGEAGIAQATSSLQGARASIESARAQVGTARARLEESVAQVAVADAALEQFRADLVAAEADDVRMSADKSRYEAAITDDAVSHQELERVRAEAAAASSRLAATRARILSAQARVSEARANLETAKQTVRQAEAAVVVAEAGCGEAEAKLTAARAAPYQLADMEARAEAATADADRARAAVRQAELDLSHTTITAPEAGRVARKNVERGSYVNVGQSILAIVPPDVWVVANFKESQLRDMKAGQPATISVDAYPGRSFRGRVDSIQAGTGARFSLLPPENATGNYVKVVQRVPVKIVFDAAPTDVLLAPGMSAEPEVETK
jgi:membrane fusion protein (multidrug efflux system)